MKGLALDNIRKVDQRGEKIEDLDEKASKYILRIAYTISLARHSQTTLYGIYCIIKLTNGVTALRMRGTTQQGFSTDFKSIPNGALAAHTEWLPDV